MLGAAAFVASRAGEQIVRIPLPTLRFIAFGSILLTTACAIWFVPQSRSRGHIFDEATREGVQGRTMGDKGNLDRVIHQRFPLGSPVGDVVEHIEGAGGDCLEPTGGEVVPDQKTTACTYESTNYYARAYWGMGEPTFLHAENDWTILIQHSSGVTTGYVVDNDASIKFLSRKEYMEGIEHQTMQE